MGSNYYAPFGGRKYVRVALDACERFAHSQHLDLLTRIMFAAMWRANDDGHAEFAPGELAHVLGSADAEGRHVPVSTASVSRAIAKAKAAGTVGNQSRARCLVLIDGDMDQGRNGRGCSTHGLGGEGDWRDRYAT